MPTRPLPLAACFVSYSLILSDIVGFVGFVLCIEKMFFLPLFFHWYVVWPFTVHAQLLLWFFYLCSIRNWPLNTS